MSVLEAFWGRLPEQSWRLKRCGSAISSELAALRGKSPDTWRPRRIHSAVLTSGVEIRDIMLSVTLFLVSWMIIVDRTWDNKTDLCVDGNRSRSASPHRRWSSWSSCPPHKLRQTPWCVPAVLRAQILGRIFLLCLAHKLIDHEQPNVNISPMTTSAPNVALATPRLWNSLYHVCYVSANVEDVGILRYGIQSIDIEFLQWWANTNIGPHPPSFRLHIETRDVTSLHRSETDVAESNHIFVLGLIASAQCLGLGYVFHNYFRGNRYQLISANLRSLLILDELIGVDPIFLSDLPTHPPQIYKKLYIEELLIQRFELWHWVTLDIADPPLHWHDNKPPRLDSFHQ